MNHISSSKTTINNKLGVGLKPRHLTMMSIAGVIGAGLFVGSGAIISKAGPAALLAYVIGGILVVFVMRMLGEMAVASPDTGSFSTYADRAIGPWAGFTIGWLYWWYWVLLMPLEANVAGLILNGWFPQIPVWVYALVVTVLLTVTNLFNVKNYGEFEFWFALIKVIAIILFLIIGSLAVLNLWPYGQVHGLSNLTAKGGFMPNGFGAVIVALLGAMFAFLGTEIVTVAASEAKNPEQQIVKTTKSVVWRICLFYVGSIFLIVALTPWTDPELGKAGYGAYRRTLELLGIPSARWIMDFVVLTSVCSCFNSALYTGSRMAFSLSKRGDAPKFMQITSATGTPRLAVLSSSAIALIMVVANYIVPEKVFNTLMSTTGTIALFVYLVISLSQLKMRRKLEAAGNPLHLKMWCFPYITYGCIIFIILAVACMIYEPTFRIEVLCTSTVAAFVVLIGFLRQKRTKIPNERAGASTITP
ncbi:amino acid permease [Neisseria sp. Ec49-e6-T10]|uniref:amino acid permease n=1 Tax=Neisseria sp. Ec49-e6-T10 TaxID=3140744 RepID=UPI003EBA2D30